MARAFRLGALSEQQVPHRARRAHFRRLRTHGGGPPGPPPPSHSFAALSDVLLRRFPRLILGAAPRACADVLAVGLVRGAGKRCYSGARFRRVRTTVRAATTPRKKRWVPASVGTNRPRAGTSTGGRAHVGRFHHSQACDILGLRRRPGMRRALAGETVGEVHIPGRGVAGHRPRRDVCPAGVPRRRMPRHVLSIAARPVTVPLGRRAAAGARPPLPGLAAVGLPRRRSGARVLWDLKRNWSTPQPRRSQRSAGRVAAKIRRAVIIRYVVAFVSWTRPDWILTVWTALLRGAAGAAGIPSRTSQTHAVILNDA